MKCTYLFNKDRKFISSTGEIKDVDKITIDDLDKIYKKHKLISLVKIINSDIEILVQEES